MSDLRYTIRSLLRAPWFTIAAVLTFAVGIGLNVAVFSIVDRMLFRELPYGDLDRLVLLRSCNERGLLRQQLSRRPRLRGAAPPDDGR